jgi:hypothetical protein
MSNTLSKNWAAQRKKADGPGVADEPLTPQSDTAIYTGLCWHSPSKSANKAQLQISRKLGKAPPA